MAHPTPFAGNSAPLPMSRAEMTARGWAELDVLIITGDAYVDHPAFGVAMIGRVLEADGWRVGVLAQPDWRSAEALKVMGTPRLFCGVTAGNLDSMLSNYTAARHRRREDCYSEGGAPGKRPNHATLVYAQLCRQAFPGVPVVLGGVEASLRRVAHYDYWEDQLRPSVLVGSKADILVFGMGERQARDIAQRLATGRDLASIPGTARLLGAKASAAADFTRHLRLPAWDELQRDPNLLLPLTRIVEREQSPYSGRPLVQFFGQRALVLEPAAVPLTPAELDALYELPFQRRPHPRYRGTIPAYTMIKDSVTVQRGCPGGCTFCSIGVHQGKFLTSRSEDSILKEIRRMTENPAFAGTISDLGGPTANLYGCINGEDPACQVCRRPSCLYPTICTKLTVAEDPAVHLYRTARETPGVKHVFVQSGIRMDVIERTPEYFRELVRHHVSGHLKVAPEHLDADTLRRMRKPAGVFEAFVEKFRRESQASGKEQYLVPYFISSFPGCTPESMNSVENYLRKSNWNLQQVQEFIPLPMTPSAAMYVTGLDFDTGKPIHVARGAGERMEQLRALRPGKRPRPRRPAGKPATAPAAGDVWIDALPAEED
jgi:uncharacterized radical SAM protein YgiQ